MKLTEKQKSNLEQAIILIKTVLLHRPEELGLKVASTELSVASDYCQEVAEQLKEFNEDEQ